MPKATKPSGRRRGTLFRKVLIANRGEIAVRIIRTCRELGIATVAVYSQADADSLHVRLADEKVCVGPPPTRESYLNTSNIVAAALMTECEAIHPGVAFLAESAHFAEACADCGLTFIGPPADIMEKMGNKAIARQTMAQAGVPVVPGSEGPVVSEQQALQFARQVGYPLVIKATMGGGGRGIRLVASEDALAEALRIAQSEAKAAFGDPSVYLERYIEDPRHIEFQVLGDQHGNVVHLGERDCSVQTQTHQKMVEEAPAHNLRADLRQRMGETVLEAAGAVGYQNAGTIEFLLDREGNFWFIEMNTRLQVEHTVTECITGLDLVEQQIRVAAGEPLAFKQEEVKIANAAVECRIDARDANNGFTPMSGEVTQFVAPGGIGVRVDTHLYPGYCIPSAYDPLLAKVITLAPTREQALRRMDRALGEMVIEGPPTTLQFQRAVVNNEYFRKGEVSTSFLRRRMGV